MVAVPTLSTHGWLTTVDKKADQLLSHFFLSDFSQSVLYHGSIKSLPYLIAEYGKNPLDLKDQIGRGLYDLMSPYFEDVSYNVQVKEVTAQDNVYEIIIVATVIENGQRYDLSYLVKSTTSTMNQFVKLNNG